MPARLQGAVSQSLAFCRLEFVHARAVFLHDERARRFLFDDFLRGLHDLLSYFRGRKSNWLIVFVTEEATLGQAAEIAGLTQTAFLKESGRQRIPIHYGSQFQSLALSNFSERSPAFTSGFSVSFPIIAALAGTVALHSAGLSVDNISRRPQRASPCMTQASLKCACLMDLPAGSPSTSLGRIFFAR